MLEERSELRLADKFERLLVVSIPSDQAPEELREDLRLAEQLTRLDLSAESQIQERLRAQLAHQLQGTCSIRSSIPAHPVQHRRWLGAVMAVLLILLLATNMPVRTAVDRLVAWFSAGQGSPAPTQANIPISTSALPDQTLTLTSNTPIYTKTVELRQAVPDHGWAQSPTPAGARAAPDHPVAVPTPGAAALP